MRHGSIYGLFAALAVYAVGLYVDPKAAKHLLSNQQAAISSREGIPEQAVFDGMLHSSWLSFASLSYV